MIELESFLKRFKCPYFFILHDKDINEDGTIKKPHFHIALDYSDGKERLTSRVKSIFCEGLTEYALVEYVQNPKAFIRYLTHKDHKEKYQYVDNDVHTNDFNLYTNYVCVAKLGKKEKVSTAELLEGFCQAIENGDIWCYADAFRFFRSQGKLDYFTTHSKAITQMIDDIHSYVLKDTEEKQLKDIEKIKNEYDI